jgi:hypothetical protein
MDLHMQLRRALIAFAVWAILGGIALSRAGEQLPAAAAQPAAAAHAAALQVGPRCALRQRIRLTPSLQLTIPCDTTHCATLRRVAGLLDLPSALRGGDCERLRA